MVKTVTNATPPSKPDLPLEPCVLLRAFVPMNYEHVKYIIRIIDMQNNVTKKMNMKSSKTSQTTKQ